MAGWKRVSVSIPKDAGGVICRVDVVHPWSAERNITAKGNFLSAFNAVEAVYNKLNGKGNFVVFLISDISLVNFIKKVDDFADVISLPGIKRAARQAKAAQGIEASKMVIPPPYQAGGAAGALTFDGLRQAKAAALSAKAMQTPGAGGADGLKAALAAFQGKRQQLKASISGTLDALAGKQVTVWACAGGGDDGRELLLDDVPGAKDALALAVSFSGAVDEVSRWLNYEL